MNVVSVICILTLVLYLLMVLTFNQRGNGRYLFRTAYSTVILGALGGVFFTVFESMISSFAAYIPVESNVLRPGYMILMLLIPFNVVILLIHMALKKKRPFLLLILAAAMDVLGIVGALLYVGLADRMDTNALTTLLTFAVFYLPYLLAFGVNGLLGRESKAEKILMDISLYLDLAVSVVGLVFIGVTAYDLILDFGISGLLPFVPFVLIWLAVPIIPLLVERYFANQDAIRNGEEPKKFVLFKKKSK